MTVTTTRRRDIYPRISHDHSVIAYGFADGEIYLGSHLIFTSTKTSVENPKWKSKVRNHQQAGTPRTIVEKSCRGGSGVVVAEWTRYSGGVLKDQYVREQGDVIYATSVLSAPSPSAAADNQARMKFYKRAKEAQTAFRSLTALGELRETLGMLRHPGRALRRGLDDYVSAVNKRARRAKRSSLNRIVSETWLEHVFGWMPFISDIKAAGEGLNRRLNRFAGNYTRISGTGTDSPSCVLSSGGASRLVIRTSYLTTQIDKTSVRYYGQIRSVCENPIAADLQLFGANWNEVVPTAWELIPYSFLVDYFSNIGDVLDAWSVRKSDIAWASKSVKSERVLTTSNHTLNKSVTEAAVPLVSWTSAYVSASPVVVTARTIERTPHTPDFPSFQMEIPGLGTKWINMSALLGARNRTRRQLFR